MRVLVAAGASGGHVYPALATAEVLRARGHEVAFAGGDRLEARLVPEAGFAFHPLPVRRPPSVRVELMTPRGVRSLSSMARAYVLARRLVARLSPDVVLGMGGFASVPVAMACGRGGPVLVLHEQNANLSFAQRAVLSRASMLALGLPLTREVRNVATELVGQPVRREVAALAALDGDERSRAARAAREHLGLDPDRTTLLVFGGSLGSVPLNEHVPQARLPSGIQVLHLCGAGREDAVTAAWERAGIPAVVFGYLDAIHRAYLAADAAVARSGALTVGELAIARLPAVLVPLPTLRRGDQEANARVLERAGGAVVVEQHRPDFVEQVGAELSRLLTDAGAREVMAAALTTAAIADGAERLAAIVEREGSRAGSR